MPMSIHPLTLEDMPAYAAVNILVNDATTTRALFSGPLSKDSIDRLFSKTHEAFKNPTTRFFKAVDDDTGEPIGFARWSVYDKPRKTESDQTEGVGYEEPAERLASLPEARNGGKTIREFFREMSTREKVLPDEKPRIELDNIFVHPDHQGRGAARILLKWGLDLADEMGLEILLDASDSGKPVYDRYGFESFKEFSFDAAKYGGEGKINTRYMLRQPKAKTAVEEKPIEDMKIEKAEALA